MIEHSEFLRQHDTYLKTPAWRSKREAVLERDSHTCQARLSVCTFLATQVHHLSYRHWRNEPLFDLAAVCGDCHGELTRDDRMLRAQIAVESRVGVASPETLTEREQHDRQFWLKELARMGDPSKLKGVDLSFYREVEQKLRAQARSGETAA